LTILHSKPDGYTNQFKQYRLTNYAQKLPALCMKAQVFQDCINTQKYSHCPVGKKF